MDSDDVFPCASRLNISIVIDNPVVVEIRGTDLSKEGQVMCASEGDQTLHGVNLIYSVFSLTIKLFSLK